MTAAQRPLSFSNGFHDTSWGAQAIFNMDIPIVEQPTLRALDSVASYDDSDAKAFMVNNAQESKSLRVYVPNLGLAILGSVMLVGAIVTGLIVLSPQWGDGSAHVFEDSRSLLANQSSMAMAAITEKPALVTNALQLPDTTQLLVEAQAKARMDYGRDDPFSPLVSPELPSSSESTDALPPPPAPLAFVGIIEGASGTNRLVAILKTTGESPITYIKEPGDRFVVDGRRVMLKRLTKREATVVVDGLPETLPLQEYSDKVSVQNTRSEAGVTPPVAGASDPNASVTSFKTTSFRSPSLAAGSG